MAAWAWRLGALAGVLGAAAALARQYRQDKARALGALRAGSQVARLAEGPIEFATAGAGSPLVILHGGGGGCEQGIWLGELLGLGGYRVIAPSRPGHRRTPLATGRSLAEQARAVRALLDQHTAEPAIVMGLSAGGLSALQFAIDHPDRCRGLILLSAHGPELPAARPASYWLWLLSLLLSSDLLPWLSLRLGLTRLILRAQGYRSGAAIFGLVRHSFPVSDWRDGTLNDLENILAGRPMALEAIRAPALLLHGTGDVLVPHTVAVGSARRIPGAELITVPGGSHYMMASHSEMLGATIRQFIARRVDPA